MFRIGICGASAESSSFTSVVPILDDFRISRGDGLPLDWAKEVVEDSSVALVPIFHARATPTGVLPRELWNTLSGELIDRLRTSLPLDGLLLLLHGSTVVEGNISGELDLVRRIRSLVGPDLPIAVALDLHGNLPPKLAQLTTLMTAYRTAPHRDGIETYQRALKLLVNVLAEKLVVHQKLISIPVVLPGEAAITTAEPARSIYQRVADLSGSDQILDCSVLVGFGWADTPHTGASVIACSAHSQEQADECAQALARLYWEERHKFAIDGDALLPTEALQKAVTLPGKVFVSDSGDNISAGAPGDSIAMLKEVLALNTPGTVFAPLVDAQTTLKCISLEPGTFFDTRLGGSLSGGESLPVHAQFVSRSTKGDTERALLRVENTEIVVLSRRDYFYSLSDFLSLGLDLKARKLIVVKLGYLFPELQDIADHEILALSNGASSLRLESFEYKNLGRPVFPFVYDL